MQATNAVEQIVPSLNSIAKRTKLSVGAVAKIVEQYSKDLNLNRLPSNHERLPDRLADNLYQILNYHKLGWSHEQVMALLTPKFSGPDASKAQTNPIVAVIKGQARLQKRINVGAQLVENLQNRVQILERNHKIENQIMETKFEMLIDLVENLRKDNETLKAELEKRTSGEFIVAKIKNWILSLF